jgi:hypothetical protein
MDRQASSKPQNSMAMHMQVFPSLPQTIIVFLTSRLEWEKLNSNSDGHEWGKSKDLKIAGNESKRRFSRML